MGYSFRLAARVLLYAQTTAFVTPVVEHWLEREYLNTNARYLSMPVISMINEGRQVLFNNALNTF